MIYDKTTIVLVISCIILVSIIIWMYYYNKKKESFQNFTANDIGHTGGFRNTNYEEEVLTNGNSFSSIGDHDKEHFCNGIPKISNDIMPYDISVADPSTYLFRTSLPRVNIFDRVARLADPYRGDVPITEHPDIALIARSQYGRDSERHDGFFSDGYKKLYDTYTEAATYSRPQYIANQGTLTS